MPAVAMPKDDWKPSDLAKHMQWRRQMYAQVKPAIVEIVPEPEPAEESETLSMAKRMEELEATVKRLQSEFVRARIERSVAQEPVEGPTSVKLDHIVKVVARFYGISMADIRSNRRTTSVVLPRQVAMYLCRQLSLKSLPEIARHVGGKDHTTVLHACRKIEPMLRSDARFCQEVAELEALFS